MSDNPMPDKPMHCDAIVTFSDAEKWARELYAALPNDLAADLVQVEPAIVGTAMNLAGRVHTRLLIRKVDERLAADIANQAMRIGLICAEMTRRGYRKLSEIPEEAADNGGAS